ncbi:unnamed protein product [Coccothraustes coccothraustes]
MPWGPTLQPRRLPPGCPTVSYTGSASSARCAYAADSGTRSRSCCRSCAFSLYIQPSGRRAPAGPAAPTSPLGGSAAFWDPVLRLSVCIRPCDQPVLQRKRPCSTAYSWCRKSEHFQT